MTSYQYQIFVPGGNKTALVEGLAGLDGDEVKRKAIQDAILAKHKSDADGEVEQVGFVNTDKSKPPRLVMTGGEFCANAVRCAAAYYREALRRDDDHVDILVSGAEKPVRAGLTTTRSAKGVRLKAWAYMPLLDDNSKTVTPLNDDGLYWVSIDGMSHLIVPQTQSAPYIREIYANSTDKAAQMKVALDFLEKRAVDELLYPGIACGVVFIEHIVDVLKIHPFVHLVPMDKTFYESACGSSAASVGLLHSFLIGESVNFSLLQPSGSLIRVEVDYTADTFSNVRISGGIEFGKTYKLEV